MKKLKAAVESNNALTTGTVSGTLLSVMPNIHSEDIVRTVILAIIGALFSFVITVILKWLTKSNKK